MGSDDAAVTGFWWVDASHMFVALNSSDNKSVINTNVESFSTSIDRNGAKTMTQPAISRPPTHAVYKRIDTKYVDHTLLNYHVLHNEGGRGVRRCWNQIYVQTLQRSTLSPRSSVKRVDFTYPEIVSRRFNPETM